MQPRHRRNRPAAGRATPPAPTHSYPGRHTTLPCPAGPKRCKGPKRGLSKPLATPGCSPPLAPAHWPRPTTDRSPQAWPPPSHAQSLRRAHLSLPGGLLQRAGKTPPPPWGPAGPHRHWAPFQPPPSGTNCRPRIKGRKNSRRAVRSRR